MNSLHLLYHQLHPDPGRYSYVIPCAEFAAHCALYAWLGQSAPPHLRPEITFDDGHSSDFAYALPILEAHGLRARFFITAGWTGKRQGFLGWSELRQMHDAGHAIGAHGMTHSLLPSCADAALHYELDGSRKALEDGLGAPVLTMSLPGGRANRRILEACREVGYRKVYTSSPTVADPHLQAFLVGRLNLRSGTDSAWLEQVLLPASGVLRRVQRADRLKSVAKTILGDRLYARLWALGNHHGGADTDLEPAAP